MKKYITGGSYVKKYSINYFMQFINVFYHNDSHKN